MRAILLVLFSCLTINASVYAQNCHHPVDTRTFDRLLQDVRAQRGERFKLRTAIRISQTRCLTSMQVKYMAQAFNQDEFKLRYGTIAYNTVYDPENFYDVYDAFHTFSMAFRLHDIVHGLIVAPPDDPGDLPVTISFPDLNYPSPVDYSGPVGCTQLIDNQRFLNIAYRAVEFPTDDEKLNYLANKSQADCFTMAQAMKFATLFENEIGQLAFMKAVLPNLFDMGNYEFATPLFASPYHQDDWIAYAQVILAGPPGSGGGEVIITCEPTPEQMQQILASFDKKHFSRDKLDLARLLVKDYCFTVAQILAILEHFKIGFDQLDFLKIMYYNCVDKHNYYQLVDTLTFSSDKQELTQFIESNGN